MGANHYMYMRCYASRRTDEQLYEQVWSLIYSRGWLSDRVDQVYFWIPERYVPFALCIDSTLRAIPSEDYIVADDYSH
jgi:hypothetical protein